MAKSWVEMRQAALTHGHQVNWEKRISDHVAYALLAYTGLQIFVVMHAIKGNDSSILPYFGLVLLVALIIPACQRFERRWRMLANSELSDSSLNTMFKRDRIAIWLLAVGLPFAFVAVFKGAGMLFA